MLSLICACLLGSNSDLKTVQGHPLQYLVSLPMGWQKGKTYPLVVGIESADREFEPYFKAFVEARGDRPYIVAVPLVVTNGGPRYKEGPGYKYSEAVWKQIDADPWKFDDEGLLALLGELSRDAGAELKVLLAGFEAGGHTLFGFMFRHPELVRAAAPVSPNYAGRHVFFSSSTSLPEVRCFSGSNDELWARFGVQWDRAKAEAREHGYAKLSEQTISGKGHVPLAGEVLNWFDSLGAAPKAIRIARL